MTDITPAEAQEIEATEEYGTATLSGVDLRVKPVTEWRPSYLRALRLADYDAWATGVLHEDDVQTFIDLDATIAEITDFTAAAMESVGETPGKSSGRAKSSTRTRKR
ncbi:hypothetical protein ACTFBT_01280 [Streptomyces microflavus]|uniref:Uncharacterized protein n=1 Tax=Streptomyces microflavus TaxID=1919 RepID=A0A7J0D4Y6_STRMI|nr:MULTISPECIES: hypothetical protein [Streptomyces]MDX2978141.1 hypothetical protein [Streptomyces sp. NRRL_B-2249]GFN09569.1 hypothetical protein Smic_81250 [Streptomyces microflavus]GGX67082.1 hypothetical protein GCM10010298_34760 [Streptomyces microflavus]